LKLWKWKKKEMFHWNLFLHERHKEQRTVLPFRVACISRNRHNRLFDWCFGNDCENRFWEVAANQKRHEKQTNNHNVWRSKLRKAYHEWVSKHIGFVKAVFRRAGLHKLTPQSDEKTEWEVWWELNKYHEENSRIVGTFDSWVELWFGLRRDDQWCNCNWEELGQLCE
jgi:hypothetical protein